MSTEQNKALVCRMIEETFNGRDIGLLDEFLAADFAEREQLPPGLPAGRDGVKQLATMLHGAFPDYHATIDDIVAEGDKVVIRQTWTGTHTGGDFMGIPPAGRSISVGVIDIVRIAGDEIVEHWGQMDSMAMMQQLGTPAVPGQE